MNVNDKLSMLYQDYRADMEAARTAEMRGNIGGAITLYRRAAKDLIDMSKMESGETRRQRILHAEDIVNKIKSLGGGVVRSEEDVQTGSNHQAVPSSKSVPNGSAGAGGETKK